MPIIDNKFYAQHKRQNIRRQNSYILSAYQNSKMSVLWNEPDETREALLLKAMPPTDPMGPFPFKRLAQDL